MIVFVSDAKRRRLGWREMAKDFAKDFYNSVTWRRCRKAYIKHRLSIDGGMCEVCHESLGYIVHHKIWLSPGNIDNPNIALSFDNLRYECQACHNREEETARKGGRYIFDGNGTLVPLPPDASKISAPK